MGQSGGPKIPADGLKTSYDFGNITSYSAAGSLKDMISGINLTLNNSPTISGILSAIVATFNGTTQTATSASLFGSSGSYARTLMAWVKPSSVANSAILSLGTDGNSVQTLFEMCIYGTKITLIWGNIFGSLQTSTQGTTVMSVGQWYFMCATNAGGSASKTYLNGVLEAATSIYTPNTSNTILTVGASGRPASINNFTGDISQAKLYLRELSAAEILQCYNAQKSRYGL
jgi:hypothetical protein